MSQNQKKKPIIEVVGIQKTAQTIRLVQPFVKVSRMLAFYEWDGTTVLYHEFAGDTILADGLQLLIDDEPLFPMPIINLESHMRYAYDTDIHIDDKGAAKHVHFVSRLSFHKFMGNEEGIDLTTYDVKVVIGDDLSSRGNELSWIFEGWAHDSR